jgi:hypothetical protein
MKLTKADPSREWDLLSAGALCPADSSDKAATADFLVGVCKHMKNPSALDNHSVVALLKAGIYLVPVEALLKKYIYPLELLKYIYPLELLKDWEGSGFGSGGGGREGGDKKTKSKYQFK